MLLLLKLTILFGIVAKPFCLAVDCPPGLVLNTIVYYCYAATDGGVTRKYISFLTKLLLIICYFLICTLQRF